MLQNVSLPIEYGLYRTGRSLGKQWDYLAAVRTATQENKALKMQMSQLMAENSKLRSQLAEDQVLGIQYQKLSASTYQMILAKVISSGRYLIINKGSENGIKADEAVVFEDSLVGQIKQVSLKSSQVILPQDPDSKIAVFSQNTGGRAKGILLGQFSSDILMDKILHQENIAAGDIVYTEGTEDKLPRGLIVGQVSRVFENTNGVFKQAQVKPLWDVADLDNVFVIENP